MAENATGTVYQATATDADGNAVTFSLAGTDAAQFTLTSAGALSFVAAPDFETPRDADANNVYVVQIRATDGTATTTLDVAVTVTNVGEPGTRRVGQFSSPTAVAAIPGSTRVFVAEKDGDVYLLDPAGAGSSSLYLAISGIRADLANYGLLGLAAAPDYATSGLLYAFVTNSAGDIEIRRYGRTAAGLGDPAGDVILRVPRVFPTPRPRTNNGGWIGFGSAGLLYLAVGDGDDRDLITDPRLNTAQDLSSLRGKILRIDVSNDAFPGDPDRDYAIPASNPFVGAAAAPEILAYGFQNPERASFNGSDLLVNDHNRSRFPTAFGDPQEVNLIRPQDAGGNFGYPYAIGLNVSAGAPPDLVPPVTLHFGNSLNSIGYISGGYVYRGPVAQYRGLYIFTDRADNRVRSIAISELVQGTTAGENRQTDLTGTFLPQQDQVGVDLGEDAAGNLFFFLSDGRIFMFDAR